MKPLSIIKFIKGSIRKILPLTITVCLSVALLYFLSITIDHVVNQNVELNVAPLSNMSILSGTGEKVSNEVLNRDLYNLNKCRYIKGWYITNVRKVNLKTPSSNNDMLLLGLKNDDIASVMKWQKLRLIAGRMTQRPGEVLLHTKLAANYGLKLDSVVDKNNPGWQIDEDVKVVGIFDGPAILGLKYVDENLLMSGKQGISVITVTDDANVNSMNSYIEKNFGNRYEAITLDLVKKEIDNKNRNINLIMNFIGVTLVIVLSVLLGNMCMIQYTQRSKEFELLYALGYTSKYVSLKVIKEIGASAILGYITGIILAIITGWLMNVFLLGEQSLGMPLLLIPNMLWILLVPVIVTLSGIVAPIKMLRLNL